MVEQRMVDQHHTKKQRSKKQRTIPRSAGAEIALLLFMLLLVMVVIARCDRMPIRDTSMDKIVHSSDSTMWETPQDFFDSVNSVYHFTTDVCAIAKNAKCRQYFSPKEDGLKQTWQGRRCWMNPPYGRGVDRWIEKAWQESRSGKCLVVALLPSRTDTHWFHDYIYHQSHVAILFLKGRLKFGGSEDAAPFPSMLAVFGG